MEHLKDQGPIAKIIFLLINEGVQNELEISRPQLKSIKEAFERLRETSMQRVKQMQKLRDSEKPKAYNALMLKLTEGADAFLAEALRSDQLKRFQQIRLQHESIGAFSKESVCKELALTKEQISNLKVKAILHKGIPNPSADVREKKIQEVMDMLSEQQAVKWQEMLGEPFDFGEIESQTSDASPKKIQRPLSQVLQAQESPSQTPGNSQRAPSPAGGQQAARTSAPAGDPFADDNVF